MIFEKFDDLKGANAEEERKGHNQPDRGVERVFPAEFVVVLADPSHGRNYSSELS